MPLALPLPLPFLLSSFSLSSVATESLRRRKIVFQALELVSEIRVLVFNVVYVRLQAAFALLVRILLPVSHPRIPPDFSLLSPFFFCVTTAT